MLASRIDLSSVECASAPFIRTLQADPMQREGTRFVATQSLDIERDAVRSDHLTIVIFVVVAVMDQIEIENRIVGRRTIEFERVQFVILRLVVETEIEVRFADVCRTDIDGRTLSGRFRAYDGLLAGQRTQGVELNCVTCLARFGQMQWREVAQHVVVDHYAAAIVCVIQITSLAEHTQRNAVIADNVVAFPAVAVGNQHRAVVDNKLIFALLEISQIGLARTERNNHHEQQQYVQKTFHTLSSIYIDARTPQNVPRDVKFFSLFCYFVPKCNLAPACKVSERGCSVR